jgi:hypothetical protein
VLRSAAEIAKLILSAAVLDVEPLLARLEFGLPAEALVLLTLAAPLNRGEYLGLWSAGIRGQVDIAALSEDDLRRLITPANAKRLASRCPPNEDAHF